jgi:hypothetical protein
MLATLKEFASRHKEAFLGAAAVILAFFIGRAAPRPGDGKETSVSTQQATKEDVDEVRRLVATLTSRTDVLKKEDLEQFKQFITNVTTQKNVATTRETVKLPDGTVKTTVTTSDRSMSAVATNSSDTSKAAVAIDTKTAVDVKSDSTGDKKTETTSSLTQQVHTVDLKLKPPSWAVGITAEYAVPSLWRDVPNYIPGAPNGLALRLDVAKHLIGPVDVVVSGSSRLEFGLGLRVSR